MELGRVERMSATRGPGDRRVQTARRRHVPHGSRSRARPPAEHAGRLRACSQPSNGTCATSCAATPSTSSSRWTATSTTLPDKHRTCVYRVIQEAMTNCARHARASTFNRCDRRQRTAARLGQRRRRRLRPRASAAADSACEESTNACRELEGTMTISRDGRQGTMLMVKLPLPASDAGGAACACCWLTITASSGGACADCSRRPG